MKMMRKILIGLILLNIRFLAIAQENKFELFTGFGISYNVHTGDDFVPGDTAYYFDGHSFTHFPHPSYYLHNSISYKIAPIYMKFFPFKNRNFYANSNLSFENDRYYSTTSIDTLRKYEPYYLPLGAAYPIKSSSSNKSLFIGQAIGFSCKKFTIEAGAKLLVLSWYRCIDKYENNRIFKYSTLDFFLFSQNTSTYKTISPFLSFSYEVSNSISIFSEFRQFAPSFISIQFGLTHKL